MPIEDKYIMEIKGTNDRGQVDLSTQSIEVRRELDVTMPECCASCMKSKPGTQWQCINPKILKYFQTKIVYTTPDLLCKYYVG